MNSVAINIVVVHAICKQWRKPTSFTYANGAVMRCRAIILKRIFAVTALFYDSAVEFFDVVRKQRFEQAEKEMKNRRKEITQAEKRIAELDRIFKRIYEDDISGAISHERFLKLSAEYEAEQTELTNKVSVWQETVFTHEQDKENYMRFDAIVRKYVGIKELTPTIVNEFIKKIIVHAPDKPSGKRTQRVDIVFNFIGEIDLPDKPQMLKEQEKTA